MTGPTLSVQCSSVDPQNPWLEQQSEFSSHIPLPVSPSPHVPYTWGCCCAAGAAGTSIPASSNWGVPATATAAAAEGAGAIVASAAAVGSSGDGSTTGPRFPTFPEQCSALVPQYPYAEQHSALSGHMAFPTDPEPHVPYGGGAYPPVDGAAATDDDDDVGDSQCSGSDPQYP